MRNYRSLRFVQAGGGVLAAAAVGLVAPAAKAVDCTTLDHKVVIVGSSAAQPFIGGIAVSFAKLSPPINIIYAKPGSCVGAAAMAATSPMSSLQGGIIQFTGTPEAAAPAAASDTCALTGVETLTVDIGASDVFAKTCVDPAVTLADDVKDFQGPWQAMNFIVPAASSQHSISYEAAYLTFGFMTPDPGLPYDPTFREVRKDTSGTRLMLASNIGLPGTTFFGTVNSATSDVINAVTAPPSGTDPSKIIGIAASGDVDSLRDKIHILAYQPKGESCGYTPDSDSSTAFDKANVRDGHYLPAGPVHFYAHAPGGSVANADVQKVLDALTGKGDPGFDLIHVEEKAGVVPDCAMRVSRTADGGALASYMPAQSCECKWLSESGATLPDSCKSCNADSDCNSAAPKCHSGFCEVK
jgi:hypothetical protein